ncbi:MAG: protoglobin domain-containing protein [Planctomycetota bacterium]
MKTFHSHHEGAISMPQPEDLLARYRELCQYVGLAPTDLASAVLARDAIEAILPELVDDFYVQILKQPETRAVLESEAQLTRLKKSLAGWVLELFGGTYDESFVERRWRVGLRHVQVGLHPIWVAAAMTRLRQRITSAIRDSVPVSETGESDSAASRPPLADIVGRMIDLDLAMIQDAYHAESVAVRLEEERDFAQGVIETAEVAVMTITEEGEIRSVNSYLSQAWNLESETDHNVFDHIVASNHNAFRDFLADVSSGRDAVPVETDSVTATDSPFRFRWHARLVPHDAPSRSTPPGQDERTAILCVGQDITDLSNAQALLVRSERLAAIGQTMAGLAHESRNAFQRSQASLETLALELEENPDAVQLIERIQRAHDHLLHLYEEVLQFARPVRLELASTCLRAVLQQTWQHVLQSGQHQKVHLNEIAVADTTTLQADAFAIEQVLRNLLENAAQASQENGSIEVAYSSAWQNGQPAIAVQVRDFGSGLPGQYTDRLFDPFFTTRTRGTGLGLPIARRLVESHGGSLKLANAKDGSGAIATMILPRVAVPDPEIEVAQDDPRRT